MGAMQKLAGLMRRAIEKYDMIQPNDRIAVGVSGGKDSVALLVGLCKLREYIGIPYEVVAITLDPCFGGVETDYTPIAQLCEQLGVSRTPFREAELELAQRRLIEIRPKIGTYVSLIDAELVEEVRHLRAVLEAEIARMACEKLTPADIDQLWENVALWRMYIERAQEEKIFELDKGFHRLLYVQCGCPYWYDLVENLAPHFDRTTILSFRCRPAKTIYEDHVSLLKAIEQKDAAAAHRIAGQHMQRYTENLSAIREAFPHYFKA